MKGEKLGEFEELTLLAIRALGDAAYGVPIQHLLERESAREVSLGAVYAALERLESKGLVRSGLSEAIAARGGRRRRVFVVTPEGLRLLHEARRLREALWSRAVRSRS